MNNGTMQRHRSSSAAEILPIAACPPRAAAVEEVAPPDVLPVAKPVDRREEAYDAEAPSRPRNNLADRMANGYTPPNWAGYRRLGGDAIHAPIDFTRRLNGDNRTTVHFRGYVVDGVPYVALSGSLAADIGLATRSENGGRIDPTAARRHFSGHLCAIRTPPRGNGEFKKREYDEVLPLLVLETDCAARGVSSSVLREARTALCTADLVTPVAAQAATPEQPQPQPQQEQPRQEQPAAPDKPQAASAGMPLPSLLARRAELRERMINLMAEQERCDADIAREFERLGGHIRSLAAVYAPTS